MNSQVFDRKQFDQQFLSINDAIVSEVCHEQHHIIVNNKHLVSVQNP